MVCGNSGSLKGALGQKPRPSTWTMDTLNIQPGQWTMDTNLNIQLGHPTQWAAASCETTNTLYTAPDAIRDNKDTLEHCVPPRMPPDAIYYIDAIPDAILLPDAIFKNVVRFETPDAI